MAVICHRQRARLYHVGEYGRDVFAYVAGPEGTIVLVVGGLTFATVGFVVTTLRARRERAAEALEAEAVIASAAQPRELV